MLHLPRARQFGRWEYGSATSSPTHMQWSPWVGSENRTQYAYTYVYIHIYFYIFTFMYALLAQQSERLGYGSATQGLTHKRSSPLVGTENITQYAYIYIYMFMHAPRAPPSGILGCDSAT